MPVVALVMGERRAGTCFSTRAARLAGRRVACYGTVLGVTSGFASRAASPISEGDKISYLILSFRG